MQPAVFYFRLSFDANGSLCDIAGDLAADFTIPDPAHRFWGGMDPTQEDGREADTPGQPDE